MVSVGVLGVVALVFGVFSLPQPDVAGIERPPLKGTRVDPPIGDDGGMQNGEGVYAELVEETVTAPVDVDAARAKRVTVELDGGVLPRDGVSDEQTSDLDERLVAFHSSEPTPAGTFVRVCLVDGGDTDNETEVALAAGENSSLNLHDGSYVAALYSDAAGLGPLTSFTVAGLSLIHI